MPGSARATLRVAIALSVLLHAVLGAVLVLHPFSITPQALPPAPALQVTLTRLPPPALIPPASPASEETPLPDPAGAANVSVAPDTDEQTVPTPEQDSRELPLQPEPTDVADSSQSDAAELTDLADAILPQQADTSAPTLDAMQLQTSLAAVVATQKDSLIQNWVRSCQRFRRPDDDAEPCPADAATNTAVNAEQAALMEALFRAEVTRDADIERLSRQLEAEAGQLAPLLDDTSVLGDIARQRHALVKATYCLHNPGTLACSGPRSVEPEGDVVTLISVGAPL